MKKSFSFCLMLLLLSLCGCDRNTEINDTRFVLDTVATITADCDEETLDGAFSLCSDYVYGDKSSSTGWQMSQAISTRPIT